MNKKILKIVGITSAAVLSALGIGAYVKSKEDSQGTVALYGVPSYLYQNSELERYEGTITGLDLKKLVTAINTINKNDLFPTDLVITNNSNAIISLENEEYVYEIPDDGKYKVSFEYDGDLITTIIIENAK